VSGLIKFFNLTNIKKDVQLLIKSHTSFSQKPYIFNLKDVQL